MRFDLRLLVAVAGIALSMFLVCTAVNSAADTEPYVVAAVPLGVGQVIIPEHLDAADAQLGDVQHLLVFPDAERDGLIGLRVQYPLAQGEIVPRGALTHVPPLVNGWVAVTVPVVDRAVWRNIQDGDFIRLWGVVEQENPDGDFVARAIIIIDTAQLIGSFWDGARVNMTLAVPDNPEVIEELTLLLNVASLAVYALPRDYSDVALPPVVEPSPADTGADIVPESDQAPGASP